MYVYIVIWCLVTLKALLIVLVLHNIYFRLFSHRITSLWLILLLKQKLLLRDVLLVLFCHCCALWFSSWLNFENVSRLLDPDASLETL